MFTIDRKQQKKPMAVVRVLTTDSTPRLTPVKGSPVQGASMNMSFTFEEPDPLSIGLSANTHPTPCDLKAKEIIFALLSVIDYTTDVLFANQLVFGIDCTKCSYTNIPAGIIIVLFSTIGFIASLFPLKHINHRMNLLITKQRFVGITIIGEDIIPVFVLIAIAGNNLTAITSIMMTSQIISLMSMLVACVAYCFDSTELTMWLKNSSNFDSDSNTRSGKRSRDGKQSNNKAKSKLKVSSIARDRDESNEETPTFEKLAPFATQIVMYTCLPLILITTAVITLFILSNTYSGGSQNLNVVEFVINDKCAAMVRHFGEMDNGNSFNYESLVCYQNSSNKNEFDYSCANKTNSNSSSHNYQYSHNFGDCWDWNSNTVCAYTCQFN